MPLHPAAVTWVLGRRCDQLDSKKKKNFCERDTTDGLVAPHPLPILAVSLPLPLAVNPLPQGGGPSLYPITNSTVHASRSPAE